MRILVPIAHGSESLETVTLVNVLRRASIPVTLASIETETVVNATRDRLAWFNIGVEHDIGVRDVWDSDEVE